MKAGTPDDITKACTKGVLRDWEADEIGMLGGGGGRGCVLLGNHDSCSIQRLAL